MSRRQVAQNALRTNDSRFFAFGSDTLTVQHPYAVAIRQDCKSCNSDLPTGHRTLVTRYTELVNSSSSTLTPAHDGRADGCEQALRLEGQQSVLGNPRRN